MQLTLLGADAEQQVHELFCLPLIFEFLADGKAPPKSVARAWTSSSRSDWAEFGGGLWGLENEQRDRLLGLVRLSDLQIDRAELTYLLHPSTWGGGLAVRMAHTAMGACFKRNRVHTIWAGADVPNKRSIAVMRALAMDYLGRVDYPAGPGVEFELARHKFIQDRIEPLDIATG